MIELNSILAPTDFSPHSKHALAHAVSLADEFGAPLHLFHAMAHTSEFGFSGVPVAQLYEDLREHAEAGMEEMHSVWTDYNFPVHCEIRLGNPFVEIIRYAREQAIDLIVVGTHGHGPVGHALLGSVAERLVRKAPCPVLTIRLPEEMSAG